MRRIFSALCALFVAVAAHPASAAEDEQFWIQAIAQGDVDGPVVYFAEIQSRFGADANGLDQMLLRAGLGIRLNGAITLYQGYAHVRTSQPSVGETREHRSFQQLNWSLARFGGSRLSSRTRLEQRRVEGRDGTGWRMREMLRLAVPLSDGGVAALGYAEAFFALNETGWGARKGFDRVRSFAGLELPLSGRSTMEAGYLNQYGRQRARADDMDHVLLLTLQLRH
ncbi:hypothetical protein J3E64_001377 [Sphingobium sp. OAS761]|uniref:DUF2490 domain-containing protein n=1 Tax=Sphingobium sp. OAS761 TaxID=2817901 RepID=UPI0020A10491|nr:DUF2490 domain-containing protein [Sphingobium sp. OAS761]MCP1469695.1 hypothetical protein [Sphingobium sp. OAS761]